MNNGVMAQEMEWQILSCFACDNELIDYTRIEKGHLVSKKGQVIFEAMKKLRSEDRPINSITVNELTGITLSELTTIFDSAPSTQVFESIEEKLFNFYEKRLLRTTLEKGLAELSRTGDVTKVRMLIKDVENTENFGISEAVDINDVIEENYKKIEEAYLRGGRLRGISVGLKTIDHYTNGIEKGNLVVIAARPGVGKTAMALVFAKNISKNAKTLFISLEMTNEKLGYRVMSQLSGIPIRNVENGRLKEGTFVKLFDCSGKIKTGQLRVIEETQTIESLERLIIHEVMKNGVEVVIVDYLSLIRNSQFYGDENARLTHNIHTLTNLAKKLNIGIICLAQLNRETEKTIGDPKMSNIKDCGSIEQDAAVIIALSECRDEIEERKKYNIKSDVHTLYAHILKSRHGEKPPGPIVLDYNKAMQSITERS